MPIKMGVNTEKLKAPEPVSAGWYNLRMEGFKPKKTKNGDSVNYNAQFSVLGGEHDGKKMPYLAGLNTGADWIMYDFLHSLGFDLDPDGNMPGGFEGEPSNPETWQYNGPLLGATAEVELVVTSWQGKPRNEIKQYRCKVDGCATKYPDRKHSTDLTKNR